MIDLSASSKWKVEEIPLLCLSVFLNGALFAFHILSAVDLLEYGNDVLQSNQDLNVVTITFSLFVVVITYILALGRSVYEFYNGGFDTRSLIVAKSVKVKPLNFRRLAAMSITVNAVHLVCYFLPYMLLSFIYNPLQTCFTYLALGFLIICVYLLFWIFTHCCTLFCTKFLDSPTNDSPTNDSSTNDSPTGDSPTGDSPTGDSPTGDSSTGDSSTGDFLCFNKIFAPNKNNQCVFCIACVFLSLGILLIAIYFSAVIIYVLFWEV